MGDRSIDRSARAGVPIHDWPMESPPGLLKKGFSAPIGATHTRERRARGWGDVGDVSHQWTRGSR